jgi:hypothetical protein
MNRQALIISAPVSNRVSFAFGEAAIDLSGITLHAGADPIILTREDWGEALTQQMSGIASAAGIPVAITEITGPCCRRGGPYMREDV